MQPIIDLSYQPKKKEEISHTEPEEIVIAIIAIAVSLVNIYLFAMAL